MGWLTPIVFAYLEAGDVSDLHSRLGSASAGEKTNDQVQSHYPVQLIAASAVAGIL